MTVTADTTDEELTARVRREKDRLRSALAEPDQYDSEQLAKLVNAIAEAEGRQAIREAHRNALAHNAPVESIRDHLTRTLVTLIGQDTWSGRANDSRRAVLDGAKQEFTDALQDLRQQ